MNIGATIKRIRKLRGITQNMMSSDCNISQTYISQLENNERNPTIRILEKIGAYLDVPYAILAVLSLTKEDIPKSKIDSYLISKPILEGLVEKIFI